MNKIKKHNPHTVIETETEHFNFKNLWNDDTLNDSSKKGRGFKLS